MLPADDSHDDDEPLERPYQPQLAQFAGAAGAADLEDDAAEPLFCHGGGVKKPFSRLILLRLSVASEVRWRIPEARFDVATLSANVMGQ